MKFLNFIIKTVGLTLAGVIILLTLGIGPLSIAYVALAIGEAVSILPPQ